MIKSIRVFDTVLSHKRNGDSVTRNSADFWKPFCDASDWGFNYERVHSLDDLEFFLSRKIKEDVIIFSGHGNEEGFSLSNRDWIDESWGFSMPEKNRDKKIIFSSCLIGNNPDLCEELKTIFKASHLFAYKHKIQDRFCFTLESILLTLMDEKNGNFTPSRFGNFQGNTDFIKNMNKKHTKVHPLVMY